MKKILFFLSLFFFSFAVWPAHLHGQSVAINADSSLADPNAILDIKSSKKGILMPRMTKAQRDLIAVPAIGLLIYQTDNTAGFYYYDGGSWSPIKGPGGGGGGGSDPFWTANGNDISNVNTGSVGIGMAPASYSNLSIQTADSMIHSLAIYGSGGSLLGAYANKLSGAIGTFSNQEFDLWCNTHLFFRVDPATRKITISDGVMAVDPNSNAQLNINTGNSQYGIMHTNGTVRLASLLQASSAWFGTLGFHPLYLFAGGNDPLVTLSPNQTVGIGNTQPTAQLHIGATGGTDFSGYQLALGSLNQGIGIGLNEDFTVFKASNNIVFWPKAHTGNVGINTVSYPPANHLQIGDLGTGWSGNDIAYGNGAQATAFAQTANFSQIASNTDIAIMPRFGSFQGRVGINVLYPAACLHVGGYINSPTQYSYYRYSGNVEGNESGNPGLSILSEAYMQASAFIVPSDVRLKNIIGVSHSDDDLKTIESIRITDYTMKDRIEFGHHAYKKVIAQEVEKVYPEAISQAPGFIPNVYRPTDTVEQTSAGLLLQFRVPHQLAADAKKLRVLPEGQSVWREYVILSIPSPTSVLVADTCTTTHIFVYGQEVSDLRRVDYDALTTLNISATQELSKEVKQLQQALAVANADIRTLVRAVRRLTAVKVKLAKAGMDGSNTRVVRAVFAGKR